MENEKQKLNDTVSYFEYCVTYSLPEYNRLHTYI